MSLDKIQAESRVWLESFAYTCGRAGAAGIQRAWFSVRSEFNAWLLEETEDQQFGRIVGQTGTNNRWYELPILRSASSLQEAQNLGNGPTYEATLTLAVPRWDVASRDLGQRLVNYRDAVFIVLDNNGTYWLVGERYGCTVSTATGSGQRGEANAVTLTATCTQPWPLRAVADSYLQGTVLPPLTPTLCELTFGEFCALSFSELCEVPMA